MVSVMSPIRITAAGERIVEPIIALAHCSKLARIIVTGANSAEAVKFAMFENGHRPQAVIMVPGILELDMSGKARDRTLSTAEAHAPLARAA